VGLHSSRITTPLDPKHAREDAKRRLLAACAFGSLFRREIDPVDDVPSGVLTRSSTFLSSNRIENLCQGNAPLYRQGAIAAHSLRTAASCACHLAAVTILGDPTQDAIRRLALVQLS